MKERHGMPAVAGLTTTACHQAGHLLMLTLLERSVVASGGGDGCGVTPALDEFAAKRCCMISQYDLLR